MATYRWRWQPHPLWPDGAEGVVPAIGAAGRPALALLEHWLPSMPEQIAGIMATVRNDLASGEAERAAREHGRYRRTWPLDGREATLTIEAVP